MYNYTNFIVSIIVLYFIFRTHGVVQILPGIWLFPLIIIALFSVNKGLSVKKKYLKFLIKESKWIILSVFILTAYKFFDYGNFKLTNTFSYLITSLPFYVIGFYYGIKFNKDFIKKITIGYFVFTFFFLIPKIVLVFSTGFNSTLFNLSFVADPTNKDFLLFLPFVSFITVYGSIQLLQSKSLLIKILAYIILLTNILAMFLSGKAGPIVILLIAITFYFFKNRSNFIQKYINIIVSTLFIFVLLFGISKGLFGELGSLKSKSTAVISFIENGFLINDDVLNRISSDRWSLDIHSIKQFFAKPIFGHGAYLESMKGMLGASANITTVAGGHSFIFDTMAFYGLFGLPLIFILVKFNRDAVKYYYLVKKNNEEHKISLIYASLLVGVLIANVLNSGFLFSSFDNFLFLLAGFYLGKYYYISKIKYE